MVEDGGTRPDQEVQILPANGGVDIIFIRLGVSGDSLHLDAHGATELHRLLAAPSRGTVQVVPGTLLVLTHVPSGVGFEVTVQGSPMDVQLRVIPWKDRLTFVERIASALSPPT